MGHPVLRTQPKVGSVPMTFSNICQKRGILVYLRLCALKTKPYIAMTTVVFWAQAVYDAKSIWFKINQEQTASFTQNLRWWFYGQEKMSCDASATMEKGGWGTFAYGWMIFGEWLVDILQALQQYELSINVLELLSCAALVATSSKHLYETIRDRVAFQNDNSSVVQAVDAGRTGSTTMLDSLLCFRESVNRNEHKFLAVHIAGKENQVAYALSLGQRKVSENRSRERLSRDT